MKKIVLFTLLSSFIFSCTKENINPVQSLEMRASGRDVCAWVSSFKSSQRKESNLSYTVTVEYSIKNCTNIIPIIISLEAINTKTGVSSTQSNLPFSGKVSFGGLNAGDSFSFRLYTTAAYTGELLDSQTLNSVVIAK